MTGDTRSSSGTGYGPCVVCGDVNYELSCGGPTICPKCDCGNFDAATVLKQAKVIADLREQLARTPAPSGQTDARYWQFREIVETFVFDPIRRGGRTEEEILAQLERMSKQYYAASSGQIAGEDDDGLISVDAVFAAAEKQILLADGARDHDAASALNCNQTMVALHLLRHLKQERDAALAIPTPAAGEAVDARERTAKAMQAANALRMLLDIPWNNIPQDERDHWLFLADVAALSTPPSAPAVTADVRAALEWYANEHNYHPNGSPMTPYIDGKPDLNKPAKDFGAAARAALSRAGAGGDTP